MFGFADDSVPSLHQRNDWLPSPTRGCRRDHYSPRAATTDPKFDYFKKHLDLQMQAASAWIAFAEGQKAEALKSLRGAAEAEDSLGKHPVSPGVLVLAREQFGSLLLERGRPVEAMQEFEAA